MESSRKQEEIRDGKDSAPTAHSLLEAAVLVLISQGSPRRTPTRRFLSYGNKRPILDLAASFLTNIDSLGMFGRRSPGFQPLDMWLDVRGINSCWQRHSPQPPGAQEDLRIRARIFPVFGDYLQPPSAQLGGLPEPL